ncbi:MAG: DUF2079 domain-containing protein, partial [Oscillospiraceae bacterium]|nr:DUF2079 domain-containing protein [Oscillospiraceae bacterium]
MQKPKPEVKPNIIFILLFSAYIITNTTNIVLFKSGIYDVETNEQIGLFGFAGAALLVFAVILVLYLFLRGVKHFHRYVLFFSSVVYALTLVAHKNLDIAYNVTVLAVLFYIISYCFYRKDENENDAKDGICFDRLDNIISFWNLMTIVAILALAYTAVLSQSCILRYKIFYSSTYDFGIFAQMFENMAKTGLQITSVERNMELSHFAVHFSPVYYLLLPFYMIFRSPESLIVMQAAAVALGAFPLALIAEKFKLSRVNILLIVITYLLYPALSGGLFFDFHENKFLTVLILWLLYFIIPGENDSRKKIYVPAYIFAAGVLMVKEDAFLYVLCAGLYMASVKQEDRFVKKNILRGGILAAVSILYFMFTTFYLSAYGLGVMTYRYNLFLREAESGFLPMILNVIKNPALLLSSLLSAPEKLEFVLYMLLPLCFLPFVSKKLNFLFLIVPMVIMNLATDYIYQYDVNFQYTFGVTPLLFFLAVKNLSEIDKRHIAKLCVAMACFSAVLFSSKVVNRIHSYNYIYSAREAEFVETEKMLEKIPMDAS